MTRWAKWELERIELALYGRRAALPTAGVVYTQWIVANARAIVREDAENSAVRREADAARDAERLAQLAADVANAPHAYARQSAEERLRWHTRSVEKRAKEARAYRRLAAKLDATAELPRVPFLEKHRPES